MDEADARLIGPDNRLRNSALGLKLLEAAVYSSKLPLQSRSVFCFAGCNLRSQVFALLLKLQLLRIARLGWTVLPVFKGAMRAFPQLLLRQNARLQSSDCRIDAGILFLCAPVEEQKDQGSNNQDGNSCQSTHPKRSPFFVDCGHHLL